MRPAEHFFSKLALSERSLQSGPISLSGQERERLGRAFSRLIAPVLGASAAEDLCYRTLERLAGRPAGDLRKLGALAAFFLGEYDDAAMSLEEEDWEEIRETLEDASGDMDLQTLTALMGELLSRGVLDRP
ncbi:MAG: hypothetical protein LBP93_00710 [Treponema sp.]|jgi:hypothetical protein|nr:hypothetical protein [Treponema sp.]